MSLAEYVVQDAKEKCLEIEVKALKVFEKEKKDIVDREIQIIDENYQQKLRENDMERKM